MKKISFNLMKSNLSRDEMRSISAGSGDGGVSGPCVYWCGSGVKIPNAPNCDMPVAEVCRNQPGPYFAYCTC